MAKALEVALAKMYPMNAGYALWIQPRNANFKIVIESAPNVSGSPGTWTERAVVMIPSAGGLWILGGGVNGTPLWFRIKSRLPGYRDSDYLGPVLCEPRSLENLPTSPIDPAAAHLFEVVQKPGVLQPLASYDDGVGGKAIAAGMQKGLAAHGDHVTFPVPYQNVPRIRLSGGITYEPRSGQWSPSYSSTSPQYEDLVALNVTATGFDVRARLRQPGSPTARTDNFAGTDLTGDGQTDEATLANAPASADLYQVTVQTDFTLHAKTAGGTGRATIIWAIDSSADGGSTWTERYTQTDTYEVEGTTISTESFQAAVPITVSGLSNASPADKIRFRIISLFTSGLPGPSTFIRAHAVNVTYTTSTDSYATKTPSAADRVTWEAST